MNKKMISIAAAAILLAGANIAPASAHVNVVPGVSATGNTTDALTIGKNNTIFFRVGHGCSAETDIKNSQGKVVFKAPVAGATDSGRADTNAFSVTVPVTALGDAGTTLPRPQYIPGWKTKLKVNSDKTATITWTAISRDFDLPYGPVDGVNAVSAFGDFGVRVAFAKGTAGQKINFTAVQTCLVDVPAAKATQTKKASKAKTVKIYETWDGTTDSNATDNNKHDAAPSVTVLG
jgi:hypothetical protein